ncbi:response regulator transcription factor [Dyella psychrodurans]|uniref:DNA-binding response regulator n=1 Tax=Dyella psychrodurans TaxID=1927960 RepID=A0A370XB11_9GAMM|nr:response regulator transcription factor [Dyella psychrodurans]RDS85395.1 DNA-binding response regulator [Dyella psychrodurans]
MDPQQNNTRLEQLSIHGRPVRVAIADDHPLLLAGLSYELEEHLGVTVVGSAEDSSELVELLNKHPVDVVISDYTMPGGNYGDGIALFGFLKRRFPGVRLIALTMMSNPAVIRSLMAQGVQCILSKADSLVYVAGSLYAALGAKRYYSPSIEAILKTHRIEGESGAPSTSHLTTRELEVVRLFVSGLTVSEIAERLHRSKQTISTQKMSAMRRLGIRRDADLIMYGVNANLTSQAPGVRSEVTRSHSDETVDD